MNTEASKHVNGLDRTDVSNTVKGLTSSSTGARQIQSVHRALSLLEILASEGNALSLSDLAARADLNSSTCHHLIATLVCRGYLSNLGRSRGYSIGQKLYELLDIAGRENEPEELLKDDLKKLGDQLGHGVQMAMLRETSLMTKLRFSPPQDQMEEPDEIFKMKALHATATGKAILAWLPDSELMRVVSANGLNRYTDNTITSLSGLIDELRLVRHRGYALDNEELKKGVVCIGTALREGSGAVLASISVTLPFDMATEKYRSELSQSIVGAAQEFSNRLRKIKR